MENKSRQSLKSFADDLKQEIEAAYLTTNNNIGWRFLTSPVSVLDKSKVAFLGLNPGGDRIPRNIHHLLQNLEALMWMKVGMDIRQVKVPFKNKSVLFFAD